MKHLPKMLGVLIATASALTAFGGVASATILTSPAGTQVAVGSEITASSESTQTIRAGFANVTCTESTIGGKVTNAGGSTSTVGIAVEEKTFTNCGSFITTVITKGSIEIHTFGTTNNGNGTITSSGTEITVGLGSTSCVYSTNNTDLGTLTGSKNTGSTATIDISASLIKTVGGFLCANPAKWEGNYKVTAPDYLDVD